MIDPTSRLLTPSSSGDESESDGAQAVVSVSSSFFPGAHETTHDTIFRTSDSVLFYLHSSIMQGVSRRAFEALIGSPSARASPNDIIDIQETSARLNIIVHALYDFSCVRYAPSFDALRESVNRMPLYNINPTSHIIPGQHIYNLFLTHAPLIPLRVYSFAAGHQLHDLAAQCSSHSLNVELSTITDALAMEMGAVYLKRLMCLHTTRQESFKSIVLQPPGLHAATKMCDFKEQKRLGRAWALAAAYLVWDGMKTDIPLSTLQSTFASLEDGLACDQCKAALKSRIKHVIRGWAAVKRTI